MNLLLCLAAASAGLLQPSDAYATVDQSHRRLQTHGDDAANSSDKLAFLQQVRDLRALQQQVRDLRNKLPSDLSICDEYFFGRQANLPVEETPWCVHGGL